MNKECKSMLRKYLERSNVNDNKYIKKLLDYKGSRVINIYDVAKIINATRSSTSRLIQRIGYKYFKDFKNDYNETDNKKTKILKSDFKKGIAIIASKRSQEIMTFLKKRIEEKYELNYFDDITKNVNKWVRDNKEKVFILISITGDSHKFNVAIVELAKLEKKPKIIILTYSKYLSIFDKYSYVETLIVKKEKTQIRKWEDYNIVLSQMIFKIFNYFNLID